jgi:hypothetical protein
MAGPNVVNFGSKVVFLNGAAFVNGQVITLPSTATDPVSAVAGDMYFNSVSNLIRFYNGTIWQDIGTGGGSNPYYVNTFTLSPTDITNQFVTLSNTPDTPIDTILTVIGGPQQSYGSDYTVSGTVLTFAGDLATGGNAALVSGDKLVIQYN